MVKELKAFEKFLRGYKVYIISILGAVYGVLVVGFDQHHWTTLGGAWTWLIGSGLSLAWRAALAEVQLILTNYWSLGTVPAQSAPVVVGPSASTLTPPTPPVTPAPVG